MFGELVTALTIARFLFSIPAKVTASSAAELLRALTARDGPGASFSVNLWSYPISSKDLVFVTSVLENKVP